MNSFGAKCTNAERRLKNTAKRIRRNLDRQRAKQARRESRGDLAW